MITPHTHAWQPGGSAPWMRVCPCGAEGHVLGAGEVIELDTPGAAIVAPVVAPVVAKKGRKS